MKSELIKNTKYTKSKKRNRSQSRVGHAHTNSVLSPSKKNFKVAKEVFSSKMCFVHFNFVIFQFLYSEAYIFSVPIVKVVYDYWYLYTAFSDICIWFVISYIWVGDGVGIAWRFLRISRLFSLSFEMMVTSTFHHLCVIGGEHNAINENPETGFTRSPHSVT